MKKEFHKLREQQKKSDTTETIQDEPQGSNHIMTTPLSSFNILKSNALNERPFHMRTWTDTGGNACK